VSRPGAAERSDAQLHPSGVMRRDGGIPI